MTEPAAEDVRAGLLRGQVEAWRTRYQRAEQGRTAVEQELRRYLTALFPGVYPEAVVTQQPLVQIAQTLYPQLLQGRSARDLPPAPADAVAPAALPAPEPEANAPAPAPAAVTLSGSALSLLGILGSQVVAAEVERAWAAQLGLAPATFKNHVLPELLRARLVQVQTIRGALRKLRGYASDVNYVLTPAGRQLYREQFGAEAVDFAAVYAGYASAACWWLHRVTKALLLAGNTHPDNRRFTYTVYDPVVDTAEYLAAGFQKRYGAAGLAAEPDLVVVVASRTGGEGAHIAIECEYANYSTPRLKGKVSKTVKTYREAGFQGVYYIAPNSQALGLIHDALGRCLADWREGLQTGERARICWWPDRAFFATFSLLQLKDAWLPTARLIELHAFNQEAGMPADDWPAGAARPEKQHRYRWPKALRPAARAGGEGEDD